MNDRYLLARKGQNPAYRFPRLFPSHGSQALFRATETSVRGEADCWHEVFANKAERRHDKHDSELQDKAR